MAANSGVYNLVRSSVTTSTAITIQVVWVPVTTAIETTRAWANQSTVVTSAQTRIQLLRKTGTAPTVTSQTPAVVGTPGTAASKCVGGTAATGITATAEGTDGTVYVEEGFNIVNGWLYLPVPEERIMILGSTASGIALKFPTAPTSAGWVSGQEWVEYAG
jgi:hypothetical protein